MFMYLDMIKIYSFLQVDLYYNLCIYLLRINVNHIILWKINSNVYKVIHIYMIVNLYSFVPTFHNRITRQINLFALSVHF